MRFLLLDIDVSEGRRIGLENALRRAIQDGRLPPRTKLPSTRALANEYGMARATIVAAYEHLVVEGYLTARHGVGTEVADLSQFDPAGVPAAASRQPRRPVDFRPGEPDTGLLPRNVWAKSLRRALAELPDESLGYGDPRGLPALRAELASYLGRARGVMTHAQQISIFGGTTSAVGFVGEMLRSRGIDRVGIEDPCHVQTRQVLELVGITPVPIAVDDEGINVEALSRAEVQAVVVTPAHQFPLGITMSQERRNELVAWANESNGWIIEDDYDGEFRFDRKQIRAFQGQAPDRTIYAGTASKILAPGLQLSWLVVPRQLNAAMAAVKHYRAGVSAIEQYAFADFIDRGELDGHLTNARAVYLRRQRAVVEAFQSHAPGFEVLASPAGLHLTALLVDPAQNTAEGDVVAAADAVGLRLVGLGRFWHGEPTRRGLVVGYSRSAGHQFAGDIARLGTFLAGWSAS